MTDVKQLGVLNVYNKLSYDFRNSSHNLSNGIQPDINIFLTSTPPTPLRVFTQVLSLNSYIPLTPPPAQ